MKTRYALTILTSTVLIMWLAGLTVVAVWPVIADPPWEKTRAIAKRETVVQGQEPAERSQPTPTPYRRRMTGAEAAEVVKQRMNQKYREAYSDPNRWPLKNPSFFIEYQQCEAVDFNDALKAWIVRCTSTSFLFNAGAQNFLEALRASRKAPVEPELFRIYDATQSVESVITILPP